MKIINFVQEMKEKAPRILIEISEGGECVKETYDFQTGRADIITVQGGEIEKAAITHMVLKGFKLPGTDEVIDGIVYQMEVFPKNPYCPMGHFNTNWTTGGQSEYYMNLDLFPAVRVKEDLDAMRRIMDDVADKFGRDRDNMREGLDKTYNMNHWESPLAAKTGCTLMKLKEDDVDFYIEAYQAFFDAYLDILRSRKGTPCCNEDLRLKLERNGKWLQYYTLKDPAVKMAQDMGVLPEVLIGLGFPPSAAF